MLCLQRRHPLVSIGMKDSVNIVLSSSNTIMWQPRRHPLVGIGMKDSVNIVLSSSNTIMWQP